MTNLMDAWLSAQRKSVSYSNTHWVPLNLEILGAVTEYECECVYNVIPARADRFDEPGCAEHIEIIRLTCKGVDITKLITDELHEAIQSEILGD
jgi:hypothetical protein